ncbi:MAG: insulinase family protein [Xanthobacteraceae bacterium]|nr:MAG: insulinase family protein [Xanthobacteraceae bacterium]
MNAGILRIAATALAVAGSAWLVAPQAARATTIQRVISPGGIEAWLVQDATVPLVAMDLAFAGGVAQDPDGKPGVASMTAALIDEGAGDLDSQAFRERLDRRAIELNFSVTRDCFRVSLRTLKENRNEAFELLRMALVAPRFDREPLERIRTQVLSTLKKDSTSPNDIARKQWWATAFKNHPYGRPANGTLDSVPTIGADDLRGYVRRVLARDGLKIAVVGDIDAAALGALLDTTFGALPAKATLIPVPQVQPDAVGEKVTIGLDVPQTVIAFGGPGFARKDPDFMAAYVVNHIAGGGAFSSRLYREVREKRGLVYSVYDNLVWLKHAAAFYGGTATRADRAAETIALIEQELRRIAHDGPTEQELAEAKSYLKGSQMLSLDTSSKIASQLVQYQVDDLGIDYIDRRNGLIDAVTIADARRVAQRLFGGGLLMTVVGRTPSAAPTGN